MDTQAWKGSKKALPTGSSLRRAATDSPFTSSGSETLGHKACALKHSPLGMWLWGGEERMSQLQRWVTTLTKLAPAGSRPAPGPVCPAHPP